jgi:hypothetical protein
MGRELLKLSINWVVNYKIAINSLFGGVGRRCRFYWRFFRLYWRPIFQKKPWFSINFNEIPRGGSGPKHSALCGACFSINPYSTQKWTKSSKSDPKNHEPSVFFNREIWSFSTPKIDFLEIYRVNCSGINYRDPIYQTKHFKLSLPNFVTIPFLNKILYYRKRWWV